EEEEIDFDKDTWGDIALNNDDDDDEEEEEKEEEGDDTDDGNEREKDNIGNEDRLLPPPKNFSTSVVDSKFFNLRQSEWIADNDIIGKSFSKDIDLMENVDSDEEEENDLMYDNFFDPPPESSEKSNEENASEVEVKSKFAQKLDDESALKKGLEEETFLAEKSWTLKGEVKKVDRPENSTLEHHLETVVAVRMKPVITEEVNKKIEGLILTRIKNQSFDSVERKIKPVVDPSQFKQKLILDQEKSSKSLAEIYEEEYLKKQEETKPKSQTVHSVLSEADENHELPIHREIKRGMKSLFTKLDSLFHFHYTPIYKPPEVKVVKNVQAITIEESTPAIVSDATLLAPQEIVAPIRGELKGKTEKDKTDRKRERRSKRKHQKLRSKREGTNWTTNKKGMKSSSAFFNEMQNVIANGTKKRKAEDTNFNAGFNKKKKGNKPQTMSKLLL
ncbi:U3 small nucleolar ribonucleoprotein MPP10, partial [Armadillidium nasatum]